VPILYLDLGDQVLGMNAIAAEELRARISQTADSEGLARLFETTAPIRTATLSAAEGRELERILEQWVAEVGIDQLWPALRNLYVVLSSRPGPA
jgi:hypothetical protein